MKQKKYWLRFGLIGGFILCLLNIIALNFVTADIGLLLLRPFFNYQFMVGRILGNFLPGLTTVYVSGFILGFIVGAVIGWIYGRVKKS